MFWYVPSVEMDGSVESNPPFSSTLFIFNGAKQTHHSEIQTATLENQFTSRFDRKLFSLWNISNRNVFGTKVSSQTSQVIVLNKTGKTANCLNGIDTRSRRQFWKYWDAVNPALFEAFAKNGTVLLFFSVRHQLCGKCVFGNATSTYEAKIRVVSAAWTCLFQDQSVVQGTVVANRAGSVNTIIVECKLPESLPSHDPSSDEALTVSFQEKDGPAHHYTDVPFCRYPDPDAWRRPRSPFPLPAAPAAGGHPVAVAACTMVKSTLERDGTRNSDLLMEWIAYHRLQGVGHFLIFAHEDPAPLRRLLAPYAAEGLVEVVDWEPPPCDRPQNYGFEHAIAFQLLQTTSCLHRYRGLAGWVGLFDVDEFMQPLAPGGPTVRSALLEAAAAADARARAGSVAALKAAGVYFFDRGAAARGENSLVTQRHLTRTADWRFQVGKCFVRPERAQLAEQHGLSLGGRTVRLDPERAMRFNHYRDGRHSTVPDPSMRRYRTAIEAEMARVSRPAGLVRRRRRK